MATCPARQCCAQACAGGLRGVRITTHAPAPARGPFRPFRTGARGAMCSTRDGHTPPRWYTRGAPRNEHISVQRAFHESRTRLAHWSLSREWTAVHCTYCTKARLAGRAPAQLFQCGHARGATRARARAPVALGEPPEAKSHRAAARGTENGRPGRRRIAPPGIGGTAPYKKAWGRLRIRVLFYNLGIAKMPNPE